MKFTQTHRTLGDETTPYLVTEYRAKTVVEFINEVLENDSEWGDFCVRERDHGFLFAKRVGYKYGKLLDEIPDEWQYVLIEEVRAVGGWGCMDYMIYPKQ